MPNADNNHNKTGTLMDFTALCVWLVTSVTMAFIAYAQYGQDFRGYYAAARVLLAGGNPYDYHQVAPILMEVTGRIGNNPFYYPLWFGWFVVPLALLPYQIARAFWMLFNLAVWSFSLNRLRSLLNWPRKGWQTWLTNLLATFIFAWTTWKFEQTGILLFAITVEILIAFKQQKWNRLGIFLALALIKPNIMLVPVVILSIWLIRNKILRPVLVLSGMLAGLVLLTTIITPDWYQPILQPNFSQGLTEVLDGPGKTTGVRLNTTLLDWLKMFQVPEMRRSIIYGVVIAVCLTWIVRAIWKSGSFMEVTVTALLVNFAITPYALQYDFPPLAVCLFAGLAAFRKTESRLVSILITSFMASVLFWERPISDGYWIVICLCILVVWGMKNKNNMPAFEHGI
jgi:hypothetical protein